MARKKKNMLPAVQSGRLVQPLTKSQSKLLDALIDDPRLSPADLCEVAGVPAYTWRRALRSPAFAAALLDAQRSALDASRLSRTQAAIEKAQTSPAFARLCFQIDGSIKEAPCLVQQFNQTQINMPIAQLRKEFESGATVQIPNLNFVDCSEVSQLPVFPSNQKKMGREGLASRSPECPTNDDHRLVNGLVRVNNTPSDLSEVVRSGTRYEVEHPKHSETKHISQGISREGAEKHGGETRQDGSNTLSNHYEVRGGQGRAWSVSRAAPDSMQPGSRAADREHDHDTD